MNYNSCDQEPDGKVATSNNAMCYKSRFQGFPGGSEGKASAYNAGDLGSIPRSGRSPREGNPLQYSCLENPMDRGAWLSTVHGVTKDLDMTQQVNNKNIGTWELNYIILSTFVFTSNFP